LIGLALGAATVIAGSIWVYVIEETEFHIGYFIVLIVYGFTAGLSFFVLLEGLGVVVFSAFNQAEITATSTIIENPNIAILKATIAIGALAGMAVIVFFTIRFFKWMADSGYSSSEDYW